MGAVTDQPILEIRNLRVTYTGRSAPVMAVEEVTLSMAPHDILGVIGESGCGKSTFVKALFRLLPDSAKVEADVFRFMDIDLLSLPQTAFRRQVLMRRMALVPQSAQNSLNPVRRVSAQMYEAMRAHTKIDRNAARDRIAELFDLVGLQPGLMDKFPHEFSGGMRQRVMIASALMLKPQLLIMDEPTTGLDMLVQERILRQIKQISDTLGTSILLITHDIGAIVQLARRIAVMYAGRVIEDGPAGQIIDRSSHPYTVGLLNSSPDLNDIGHGLISIPGSPPDLSKPLEGCSFSARCPIAKESCRIERPDTYEIAPSHRSACLRLDQMSSFRLTGKERATWHF